MNRQIKFRVWDGERMSEVGTLLLDRTFQSHLFVPETGYRSVTVPPPEEMAVMQYTGLKDADGQEIYEGDVIEYVHPRFEYSSESSRFEVRWDDIEAQWGLINSQTSRHNMTALGIVCREEAMTSNHAIVIGNVFENPDLLQNDAARINMKPTS